MEQITSNEFLNSVLETEAWKTVSEDETLTMDILEKYADKLDWKEISSNSRIVWTNEGLEKFSRKINWDDFTDRCPDNLICEALLRKFENKWNWKGISNREVFYNNWDLVEKFADKVDWAEIITNWNIEKPLEFFKRFQQYIPMAKLQDSRLWNEMISARAGMILKEMIGI